MADRFFATIKLEAMPDGIFASREQARLALFDYPAVFHNRRQLHSGFESVGPVSRPA